MGRLKLSLSNSHPSIAVQWDLKRNKPLTPDLVTSASKNRVWWICSEGHSYQVSIYSRVRSNGCKTCNVREYSEKPRRTKLSKSMSLSVARPDLLSEWDYKRNNIQPEELSAKSGRLVWWRCKLGHQWQSTPKRRSRGGCPACAKESAGDRVRASRLRSAGISLEDARPELMSEWNFEDNEIHPSKLTLKSNYRAHWKCRFGHEWSATVVNRTHNLSGCPYCTNQTSRLEIYLLCELMVMFPIVEWRRKIVGVEADIYIPSHNVAIEVDGEYWHRNKVNADKNKEAHFALHHVELVRVRDSRLPIIGGEVVTFSIAEQMLEISIRLAEKLKNLGKETPALANYLEERTQANEASYREMIACLPAPPKGESLLDRYPKVAAEWDANKNKPLTPDLFSAGSDQKVGWICSVGHKWQASIKNRTLRGSNCPACDRSVASARLRNLQAEKHGSIEEAKPNYLSMWDYEKNGAILPSSVAITSRHKVFWKCLNGHSFVKSPAQMKNDHSCPKCHSLSYLKPDIAAEWDIDQNGKLRPDEVTPGSGKRVWWKCSADHRWRAVISMRTADKTGCPICFEERRSKDPRSTLARRNRQPMAEYDPTLLSEWDYQHNLGINPNDISISSKVLYWWHCDDGHLFQMSANQRSRNRECPTCSKFRRAEIIRRAKLARSGSLYENYPEIASQWHPRKNGLLSPRDISSNSHKKIWWLCPINHEWEQSPNYRVTLANRGSKHICPECAKNNENILLL